MNIGRKILIAALSAVALSVGVGVVAQGRIIREHGEEQTRNTMRAVVMEAENVRESISALNRKGAFDRAKLLAEYKASGDLRGSTLYGTIPVVAAWRAIEKAAAAQSYTFRVPKHEARNPKNTPTPEEDEILKLLEDGTREEYFSVDRKTGLITYARPIKLSADCLTCHGDPATSPTGDGKDIVGFKMENWKEGEVHGAFVLQAPTAVVDDVARAGLIKTILWTIPVAVLISLGFVMLNRRLIVRPLVKAIGEIDAASAESAAASEEISKASQQLAEGASEQAASLEETSATLEEIGSMTQRNSENAQQARKLAEDTRSAADQGEAEVRAMVDAMNDIKSASDNISKIIKTIDEIAFQTNLLALNAAVEAARAGEAGAGFAVVAGEVRTLSQRAATAAKETEQQILDAIGKSERGVAVSSRVSECLGMILARAREMEKVITDIAAASNEQTTGIHQVNTAVAEMDKVTQANAASAEESASASAHLAAQAKTLKEAIDSLASVVGASEEALRIAADHARATGAPADGPKSEEPAPPQPPAGSGPA